MADSIPHISICICTFKRPQLLTRLLHELAHQQTDRLFTYSIVVVDNDASRSAETIVTQFAAACKIPTTYCPEPQQSIPLARNRSISCATGDYIAFIDDDEFPEPDWLLRLYVCCNTHDVAGVLGPVLRHFDKAPPKWISKGNFYVRPRHSTGFLMPWEEGRTGNVLLKAQILARGEPAFNPSGHRGQDVEFFRRMTQEGHVFIWCDEAVVHESVPPGRWSRIFMLKRALLRGTFTARREGFHLPSVARSVIAVPVYATALPFAFVLGQHRFMNVLIRLCDHLGKLLTLLGREPMRNDYVTD